MNDLLRHLEGLKIQTLTVPYPEHKTVEEGRALRGEMSGTFTKNLLLKDKKGRLFLLIAEEMRVVDLKSLHLRVRANGRLGFAPPEVMQDLLGVDPGSATPFGLIHDREREVTPVVDASLMDADFVNFHPLVQTLSTSIRPKDLMAFFASTGHKPLIVDLDGAQAAQ
jgi:Ala-tRNA(Pro) deacylase